MLLLSLIPVLVSWCNLILFHSTASPRAAPPHREYCKASLPTICKVKTYCQWQLFWNRRGHPIWICLSWMRSFAWSNFRTGWIAVADFAVEFPSYGDGIRIVVTKMPLITDTGIRHIQCNIVNHCAGFLDYKMIKDQDLRPKLFDQ